MASKKGNGRGADLSTEILREIRAEMKAMRKEQHATNERLDATNERLDGQEKRQTEDSVRLATELVAVARAVDEVRDLLRDQRIEREPLEDHETRIQRLENRGP
jgi:hypothetical protein